MNGPKQRIQPPARQDRPSHHGLAVLLGISCLSFLSGCAQLDQLMGKHTDAVEPAQTAAPKPHGSPPAAPPVQAAEPPRKPIVTKKPAEPRHAPTSVAKDPLPEAPAAVPATPSTGVTKALEPQTKKPDQEKALVETDQPKKEKNSRAASDKKSKKSPKPQGESKPPTEDASLPPVPLPSKPAAIGGSGG
jgi:hypothetical protein